MPFDRLSTQKTASFQDAIYPIPVSRRALAGLKVWQADLALSAEPLALGWTWLDAKERQKARAFATETLSHRYVAAHALARYLLAAEVGCPPEELHFTETAEGKPRLVAPFGKPYFNFSHSGSRLLLGIHWEVPIGVDIESLGEGPVDEGLPETCLTEKELETLAGLEEGAHRDRFIRFWTVKEAALKAEGSGFSIEPTELEVDLDQAHAVLAARGKTFSCHALDVGPGYKAAVAYENLDIFGGCKW